MAMARLWSDNPDVSIPHGMIIHSASVVRGGKFSEFRGQIAISG